MNRNEAKRLRDRHFRSRPGKGDHLLYFDESVKLVFGLAVCSKSNGDLLKWIAKQVSLW